MKAWKGYSWLCTFSAPTQSLQVGQVTGLHGVCVPWKCGSAGARLLADLPRTGRCCVLLPCKHCGAFSWGSCDTGTQETFCKHRWAGGRRNRREMVVSASSGKPAGKSHAGPKFSASGVLVMVLGSTGRRGNHKPAHSQP